MNIAPGSAFFQTVQGSAASSGASAGGGAAAQSVQASSPASSATDRQRTAPANIQMTQQLRAGPPGTNLNIIV
ncbi:MAG: hypothetical protein O3C34_05805 [Proteobacteria bacterium]|nr:hypothetical protein [Pseudomonadota bacterium]